jgi:MoxR-like ATPase
MKISLGYPGLEFEKDIVTNYQLSKSLDHIHPVATRADILTIQEEVDAVNVHPDVLHYMVSIVNATRHYDDIHLGASPRVSIDLFRSTKALAYLNNRSYVLPDDVKSLAPDILNHRLMLSAEARIEGKTIQETIKNILHSIHIPVVTIDEN